MTESEEYLLRTYPLNISKEKMVEGINDFDTQMILAINKMKEKYNEMNNRKCVKVLTEQEFKELQSAHVHDNKKAKNDKKPVKCTAICKATKMNGEICTAKAKVGCEYCGRHIPKN